MVCFHSAGADVGDDFKLYGYRRGGAPTEPPSSPPPQSLVPDPQAWAERGWKRDNCGLPADQCVRPGWSCLGPQSLASSWSSEVTEASAGKL